VPDLLVPAHALVTIEQDEVPFINDAPALIHISCCLFQPLLDCLFQVSPLYLQFEYNALEGTAILIGQRLRYQQVGAATAQTILTVDVATAVH
jgi:hypothetical protein